MRRAAFPFLLAALLLGLAYHLIPLFDPQRPLISLAIASSFVGGYAALTVAAARVFCPPEAAQP